METVTVKMEARHIRLLSEQAKTRRCSKAAVIRELVEQHLEKKVRPSLHDQAKDVCGYFSGSKDLSTRKLRGYGRD